MMSALARYGLLLLFLPFGAEQAGRAVPPPAQAGRDAATYWRAPDELWVYDSRPEVGVGTHSLDASAIQRLRDLKVRLVRHTMYWNRVEGAVPGEYEAASLRDWDARVRRAREAGLELVVVVHGDPPGLGFANREEAYRRFARFMGDMAARYPSVRFWELWNEMDQGFTDLFGAGREEIGMRQRGRMYARMLSLAYPAIERANPHAWVLMGGMVDHDEFLSGVYDAGGGAWFDFLNLHTYGAPVVQSLVGKALAVDSVMRVYGDEGRPLWNTEFGIDAGAAVTAWGFPHDLSGEPDGEALDRWHLQNWREPIEANQERRLFVKVIGYQLSAGNETAVERVRAGARLPPGRTPDDYGFGLLRADGHTPRPAYLWLREADPNAPLRRRPERVVEVEVDAPAGRVPRDHEYDVDSRTGRMIVRGVRLGTLQPTVVRFGPAA